MPYDSEQLARIVEAVDIRSASVTFSCKVSVREAGDVFRGVEAGMTVNLRVAGLDGVPADVVKLAALRQMPMLMSKVYTDLVIGDVMTPAEARARIAKATEFYEAAYQRVLHGGDDAGVGAAGVSNLAGPSVRAGAGPDGGPGGAAGDDGGDPPPHGSSDAPDR